MDACEKLRETVRASLARYEPEILTVYERDGRAYSGLLELLATLINGEGGRAAAPGAVKRGAGRGTRVLRN